MNNKFYSEGSLDSDQNVISSSSQSAYPLYTDQSEPANECPSNKFEPQNSPEIITLDDDPLELPQKSCVKFEGNELTYKSLYII